MIIAEPKKMLLYLVFQLLLSRFAYMILHSANARMQVVVFANKFNRTVICKARTFANSLFTMGTEQV